MLLWVLGESWLCGTREVYGHGVGVWGCGNHEARITRSPVMSATPGQRWTGVGAGVGLMT